MKLIHMAKISTTEGTHWFNIGECEESEALEKAYAFTVETLLGLPSQVKEVMPKIEWIRDYDNLEKIRNAPQGRPPKKINPNRPFLKENEKIRVGDKVFDSVPQCAKYFKTYRYLIYKMINGETPNRLGVEVITE